MTTPSVAVIGLGCIGGSLASALAEHDVPVRGWSTSPGDRAQARARGIDVPESGIEQAVTNANAVIIAVPSQAIADVAAAAMRGASADAPIVHCGGVQSRGALHLDDETFARTIGAHPLAGSHDSGFGASRATLFAGCTVSIEARASESVRERMKWLWTLVGAHELEYRSAEEHDAMMVWVSHLPQLAATALAATLATAHIDPTSVGPGARDSTRIAASSFDQWSALIQAQPALLEGALRALESSVASIRTALAHGDERALRKLWESAQAWRRDAEPAS